MPPHSANSKRMRSLALILGVLVVAVAALVATGAYRPAGGNAAEPAAEPATAPGPGQTPAATAPPAGALVLGAQADDLAVGLAVVRQGASLDLTATVIGQEGTPVDGLDLRFGVHGARSVEEPGEPCGSGCYRASVPAQPPVHVAVDISGANRLSSASFLLPPKWRPAPAIVRRATEAFRSLRSVVYDEHLESRPGQEIQTRWTEEAPNRLSFRIAGGGDGIVIGDRRWDRQPGSGWIESPQDPLALPEPVWGGRVENASLLGSDRIGGRPTWIVSFLSPGDVPTWFTVWLEKDTARPVQLRMTTAAHFMTQRYRSFDERVSIEPPR